MFKTLHPLILASESPRRKSLLLCAGVIFEAHPSKIEDSVGPDESDEHRSPAEIAKKWACMKADSVSPFHPESWILGADTIVAVDGRIFGKPSDSAGAVRMLDSLSNRAHEVITGVCLLRPGGMLCRSESVTTVVHFKALSVHEIMAYVNTGEPMDKAGAYGIQGPGAFLVKKIEGSYTNVVGLPLCETLDWLMTEKIIEPESGNAIRNY